MSIAAKGRSLDFSPKGWTPFWAAALTAIVFYAFNVSQFISEGRWWINASGGPVDMDFVCFWTASKLVAAGEAAAAFDVSRLAELSRHARDYPFFYPPAYLLMLAPIGGLSFTAAAAVFVGFTAGCYIAAARAIDPRPQTLMLAIVAPAAFLNAYIGQNGMLTAGLFAGALVLLDRRPIIAGLLLAVLAYKPQFGVLIPLVLAATGRWRVFAVASVGVVAINLVAGLVLGWAVFPAFLHGMTSASGSVLAGAVAPWKMQTAFGAVLWLGGERSLAWTVQGLFALPATVALLAIWRSSAPYTLKAAALPTIAVLVSPYGFIYDAVILVVPVLFLIRDGARQTLSPVEIGAIAAALLLPFTTLVVEAPLCLAATIGIAAVIARRWLTWRMVQSDQPTAGSADNSALPA